MEVSLAAPIKYNGAPLVFRLGTLSAPLYTPFELSCTRVTGGGRATLLLEVPGHTARWLAALEGYVRGALEANYEQWAAFDPEGGLRALQSGLKAHAEKPHLRVKVVLGGSSRTRCWDARG